MWWQIAHGQFQLVNQRLIVVRRMLHEFIPAGRVFFRLVGTKKLAIQTLRICFGACLKHHTNIDLADAEEKSSTDIGALKRIWNMVQVTLHASFCKMHPSAIRQSLREVRDKALFVLDLNASNLDNSLEDSLFERSCLIMSFLCNHPEESAASVQIAAMRGNESARNILRGLKLYRSILQSAQRLISDGTKSSNHKLKAVVHIIQFSKAYRSKTFSPQLCSAELQSRITGVHADIYQELQTLATLACQQISDQFMETDPRWLALLSSCLLCLASDAPGTRLSELLRYEQVTNCMTWFSKHSAEIHWSATLVMPRSLVRWDEASAQGFPIDASFMPAADKFRGLQAGPCHGSNSILRCNQKLRWLTEEGRPFYFEVEITKFGIDKLLVLGWLDESKHSWQKGNMLGWVPDFPSFGFHTDDGTIQVSGASTKASDAVEEHEIVGTGWDGSNFFFTANGKIISIADSNISGKLAMPWGKAGNFIPALTAGYGTCVMANFGTRPFVFKSPNTLSEQNKRPTLSALACWHVAKFAMRQLLFKLVCVEQVSDLSESHAELISTVITAPFHSHKDRLNKVIKIDSSGNCGAPCIILRASTCFNMRDFSLYMRFSLPYDTIASGDCTHMCTLKATSSSSCVSLYLQRASIAYESSAHMVEVCASMLSAEQHLKTSAVCPYAEFFSVNLSLQTDGNSNLHMRLEVLSTADNEESSASNEAFERHAESKECAVGLQHVQLDGNEENVQGCILYIGSPAALGISSSRSEEPAAQNRCDAGIQMKLFCCILDSANGREDFISKLSEKHMLHSVCFRDQSIVWSCAMIQTADPRKLIWSLLATRILPAINAQSLFLLPPWMQLVFSRTMFGILRNVNAQDNISSLLGHMRWLGESSMRDNCLVQPSIQGIRNLKCHYTVGIRLLLSKESWRRKLFSMCGADDMVNISLFLSLLRLGLPNIPRHESCIVTQGTNMFRIERTDPETRSCIVTNMCLCDEYTDKQAASSCLDIDVYTNCDGFKASTFDQCLLDYMDRVLGRHWELIWNEDCCFVEILRFLCACCKNKIPGSENLVIKHFSSILNHAHVLRPLIWDHNDTGQMPSISSIMFLGQDIAYYYEHALKGGIWGRGKDTQRNRSNTVSIFNGLVYHPACKDLMLHHDHALVSLSGQPDTLRAWACAIEPLRAHLRHDFNNFPWEAFPGARLWQASITLDSTVQKLDVHSERLKMHFDFSNSNSVSYELTSCFHARFDAISEPTEDTDSLSSVFPESKSSEKKLESDPETKWFEFDRVGNFYLGCGQMPDTGKLAATTVIHSVRSPHRGKIESLLIKLGKEPICSIWIVGIFKYVQTNQFRLVASQFIHVDANLTDVQQHIFVEPALPISAGEYVGISTTEGHLFLQHQSNDSVCEPRYYYSSNIHTNQVGNVFTFAKSQSDSAHNLTPFQVCLRADDGLYVDQWNRLQCTAAGVARTQMSILNSRMSMASCIQLRHAPEMLQIVHDVRQDTMSVFIDDCCITRGVPADKSTLRVLRDGESSGQSIQWRPCSNDALANSKITSGPLLQMISAGDVWIGRIYCTKEHMYAPLTIKFVGLYSKERLCAYIVRGLGKDCSVSRAWITINGSNSILLETFIGDDLVVRLSSDEFKSGHCSYPKILSGSAASSVATELHHVEVHAFSSIAIGELSCIVLPPHLISPARSFTLQLLATLPSLQSELQVSYFSDANLGCMTLSWNHTEIICELIRGMLRYQVRCDYACTQTPMLCSIEFASPEWKWSSEVAGDPKRSGDVQLTHDGRGITKVANGPSFLVYSQQHLVISDHVGIFWQVRARFTGTVSAGIAQRFPGLGPGSLRPKLVCTDVQFGDVLGIFIDDRFQLMRVFLNARQIGSCEVTAFFEASYPVYAATELQNQGDEVEIKYGGFGELRAYPSDVQACAGSQVLGGELRMRVNGELVALGSAGTLDNFNRSIPETGSCPFHCWRINTEKETRLHEVRIWKDDAFSKCEEGGLLPSLTGEETNLVAWYPIRTGFGAILFDFCRNSIPAHGKISGRWAVEEAGTWMKTHAFYMLPQNRIAFGWDRTHLHSSMSIPTEGHIWKRLATNSHRIAVSDRELEYGRVYRWAVRLLDGVASINVGVLKIRCGSLPPTQGNLRSLSNAWCLDAAQGHVCQGFMQKHQSRPASKGDFVLVELDLINDSLKFGVNGLDEATVFRNSFISTGHRIYAAVSIGFGSVSLMFPALGSKRYGAHQLWGSGNLEERIRCFNKQNIFVDASPSQNWMHYLDCVVERGSDDEAENSEANAVEWFHCDVIMSNFRDTFTHLSDGLIRAGCCQASAINSQIAAPLAMKHVLNAHYRSLCIQFCRNLVVDAMSFSSDSTLKILRSARSAPYFIIQILMKTVLSSVRSNLFYGKRSQLLVDLFNSDGARYPGKHSFISCVVALSVCCCSRVFCDGSMPISPQPKDLEIGAFRITSEQEAALPEQILLVCSLIKAFCRSEARMSALDASRVLRSLYFFCQAFRGVVLTHCCDAIASLLVCPRVPRNLSIWGMIQLDLHDVLRNALTSEFPYRCRETNALVQLFLYVRNQLDETQQIKVDEILVKEDWSIFRFVVLDALAEKIE